MTTTGEHQREVDRNYEAFKGMLPNLLETDPNRFALLRHGELITCFDTSRDAVEAGRKMFDDELFSVQEITSESIDLGFFSHAGILRTV